MAKKGETTMNKNIKTLLPVIPIGVLIVSGEVLVVLKILPLIGVTIIGVGVFMGIGFLSLKLYRSLK